MRRRSTIPFVLMLLAAAALHAVSVARQSPDATTQNSVGGEDYICTACGPIPRLGVCPVKPAGESRSAARQP